MNVNQFYQEIFGQKVYKISLDAGCTCPTRDGSLGTGGCIFCGASGAGEFAASRNLSITEQVQQAKTLLAPKLKNKQIKYIAYFQNFTNTYGNLTELRAKWEEALACPDVVGLAIGTRPDCLGTDVLQVLGELSLRFFVQVELGFQTSCESSIKYIRRHFSNETYRLAVESLHKINPEIHVVTHIIFGLPGETSEQMMDSVQFALDSGTDGIKIANLYVTRGTDLLADYEAGKVKVLEMDEYFDLLKSALQLIPENVVIHRLTGDPAKAIVVAPMWCCNKKVVLNKLLEITNN